MDDFTEYTQISSYAISGAGEFTVTVTVTYDRNVIGRISPYNICKVQFVCSVAIDEWECRATLNPAASGLGIGLLMKNGGAVPPRSLWNGSIKWDGSKMWGNRLGNVPVNFDITDTQLTQGDGTYRISVYVKVDGVWYGG